VRVEEILVDVRREDDVHLFFQLPFLGTVVVSSHPPQQNDHAPFSHAVVVVLKVVNKGVVLRVDVVTCSS